MELETLVLLLGLAVLLLGVSLELRPPANQVVRLIALVLAGVVVVLGLVSTV